jgi:zinc transport system substrate-binding protein
VGSVTLNPDQRPGAKRIHELRSRIQTSGAACIFREPQFEPSIIRILTQDLPVRIAVLDPLGADLPPGPEAYFTLMTQMGNALSDCLGQPLAPPQ